MKRYIITYYNNKEKIGVFVVKAKNEFKARTTAFIYGIDRRIKRIIAIRELYNPVESESTAWMFKSCVVPPEEIENYVYWESTGYTVNYLESM